MRTASSFEGHENHKFSVFFCLTLSEKSWDSLFGEGA
jgi:hypothetical protein